MGYPTPNNLPTERVCREIFIPDDPLWLAVYNGLMSYVTNAWAWEKIGTLTPEECAAEAANIYYEFVDSECGEPPVSYFEGARVRKSTNTAIPNSTDASPPFDVEVYDTDNMWSSSIAGRLTIQTAGIYVVTAAARWDSFIGTRAVRIRMNAAGDVIAAAENTPNNAGLVAQTATCTFKFDAGDYVYMAVFQTSGVAQNLLTGGIW